MLTDAQLEALNIYMEAGGEPDEGKAAVARVVRNRMRAKFLSDGTLAGTILAKDQFSWAYFAMIDGKYRRVCATREGAAMRAASLFRSIPTAFILRCMNTASLVASGTYYSPRFAKLGYDAVSYLNPRILTGLPDWAIPEKFIVSIGRHDFYRATPAAPPFVA